MGIFSVLGEIAKTVLKVGQVLIPILKALRGSSHEIDDVLDRVDDVIEGGGEIADDFFDRNIGSLEDMNTFFVELEEVAKSGGALTAYCIEASRVVTPDQITPEEGKRIALMLVELKSGIVELLENSEGLEEKLEAMV